MGGYSVIDIWAAMAAAFAGGCLAIRGNMLKPHVVTWASPPPAVYLALIFQSIVLFGVVLTIFGGAHASAREAMAYTAVAIASLVMLVNLAFQREGMPDVRS